MRVFSLIAVNILNQDPLWLSTLVYLVKKSEYIIAKKKNILALHFRKWDYLH